MPRSLTLFAALLAISLLVSAAKPDQPVMVSAEADAVALEATPTPTPKPPPAPTVGPELVHIQTTLAAGSRSASPGSAAQIPIRLESASSLSSLGFSLSYDQSMAQVTEVLRSPAMAQTTFTYDAEVPGVIRFGYASTDEINRDGLVGAVKFKVAGNRGNVIPLVFSGVSATDSSGNKLPVRLVSGSLSIQQRIAGDGNGDGQVTALDALIALRMFVQAVPEDLAADVNGDGRITPDDARQILEMASPGYRNPS